MRGSNRRATKVREEYQSLAKRVKARIAWIVVGCAVPMVFVHGLVLWLCPQFWPVGTSDAIAANLRARASGNTYKVLIPDNQTAYLLAGDYVLPLGISDMQWSVPDLLRGVIEPNWRSETVVDDSQPEGLHQRKIFPVDKITFIPVLNNYIYLEPPTPSEWSVGPAYYSWSYVSDYVGTEPILESDNHTTVANNIHNYYVALYYKAHKASWKTSQRPSDTPGYISAHSQQFAAKYAANLKRQFEDQVYLPSIFSLVIPGFELVFGAIFAFLISQMATDAMLKRMRSKR